MSKSQNPFIRLLFVGKEYWKLFPVAAICAFIYVACYSAVMWLGAGFLKLIFTPNSETLPVPNGINETLKYYTWKIIGEGTPFDKLLKISIILLILYFFAAFFKFLQNRTLLLVEQKLAFKVRSLLFEKYLSQSIGFFHKRKAGELMTTLLNDAQSLNHHLTKVFAIFLREPASILVSIVLLASISLQMLIITLLIIPLAGILINAIGKSLKRKSTRVLQALDQFTVFLNERFSGIHLIKTSGTEQREIQLFHQENQHLFTQTFRQRQLDLMVVPSTEVLGMVIIVTILLVGGYKVLFTGIITAEDFLRFILLLFAMLAPARALADGWSSLNITSAAGKRIFDMLDTDESLWISPNPKPLPPQIAEIEFHNVSFRYQDNLPFTLKNINLRILPQEMIALVGLSGAGKSTLFHLLLRLYDPTEGKITYNTIDIREYDPINYRKIFGIVSQDTILFHDTVANNIAYGLDEQSSEKIVYAAKLAYADPFIQELDNGYHTIVGDRGVRLSGGQKQRISLARAFIREPKILLLDEATSNLDSDSEKLIQTALEKMKNQITILIIAHRLATIRNADRIILLDAGEILDIGTYQELMHRSELFQRLSRQQFLV
ncbi:MAG: ABC transporter ATP-binding protein/permease [bacterium]|nr:ABC transporter ATP-binding protein/permease [bacterium]